MFWQVLSHILCRFNWHYRKREGEIVRERDRERGSHCLSQTNRMKVVNVKLWDLIRLSMSWPFQTNLNNIISGKVELKDLVLKPSALVSMIKTSTQHNLDFPHWFLVYWMSNSNLLICSPLSASISIDYSTVPVYKCNTRYVVLLSHCLHINQYSTLTTVYTCMLDNIFVFVNSFVNEGLLLS